MYHPMIIIQNIVLLKLVCVRDSISIRSNNLFSELNFNIFNV